MNPKKRSNIMENQSALQQKYANKVKQLSENYIKKMATEIDKKYEPLKCRDNQLSPSNKRKRREEIAKVKNDARLIAFKVIISNFHAKFDTLFVADEVSEHEDFLKNQEFGLYSMLISVAENSREKAFLVQQYIKNSRVSKRFAFEYEKNLKNHCVLSDDLTISDRLHGYNSCIKIGGIGYLVFPTSSGKHNSQNLSDEELDALKLAKYDRNYYCDSLQNEFAPFLQKVITPKDAKFVSKQFKGMIEDKTVMPHASCYAYLKQIKRYDNFDGFYTQTCVIPSILSILKEIESEDDGQKSNQPNVFCV